MFLYVVVVTGNRLLKSCGKDPALLCRPCEPNKYTTNPKSFSCMLCTQCTGMREQFYTILEHSIITIILIIHYFLPHYKVLNVKLNAFFKGPQFTLKPCNITSDTVCGCKAGYRCGNERCSYCVTECQTGEEPTELRNNFIKSHF